MNAPAALFSVGFARGYLVTLRPYLCFVSGATGLVGLALTRSLSSLRFFVATCVFFVVYGLGQALTDVTQLDTDSLSSPYRPMVRGELRPRHVLFVSLVGLGACALVLASFNPATAVVAGLSVIGLATYTPMKRRFWAGPGWNSWIVALLPLLAALCDGRGLWAVLAEPRVRTVIATTFFAYATFVLLGYLKDVEADRRTGYATLPVRFGRRLTVGVSALSALAALAISAPLLGGDAPVGGLLLWALGAGLLVLAHVQALAVTRDAAAHRAIATGLRGYVALHLGEAVILRPTLLVFAVALLVAFELVLARRPCQEQV
jgi:4-hydroxybenzoate polyprenyltransferase